MRDLAQVKEWDFDIWMNLARNDPEKFEVLRAQVIERLIEAAPEERKMHLRRIQWRVDRVRERSGTPMAATLAISRMMWESFYDLRDQYHELFDGDTAARRSVPAAKSAQVLAFRQPVHA